LYHTSLFVVTQNGNTPLHLAVKKGHEELTAFMLIKGASVDDEIKVWVVKLHYLYTFNYFFHHDEKASISAEASMVELFKKWTTMVYSRSYRYFLLFLIHYLRCLESRRIHCWNAKFSQIFGRTSWNHMWISIY
jgi:hypothetical protein